MQLLVLGAGYATRLHPLTLNQPKPLLHVGGKPMMDYVIEHALSIPQIHTVHVVTNARFAPHFEGWMKQARSQYSGRNFILTNDGSTDDSNKLGAIGDIHLVLKEQKIDDNLIVIAGDNLFSESLANFGSYCFQADTPVLGVYDVGDLEQIKKYNNIEINSENIITAFEEKPQNPKSTVTGIALYYYPKSTLPLIHQYVAEGNNTDQPGRLIQWLYTRVPVRTWSVPGMWYDIGSKETLEEADQAFSVSK